MMTAIQAIQLGLQLVTAYRDVAPQLVDAYHELKDLIEGGAAPNDPQIQALFDRIATQSAAIQKL